ELKRVKIALGGNDLKKLGYVPGPVYTRILQAVLTEKLEGRAGTRKEEIDFVLKYFPGNGEDKRKTAGARRKANTSGLRKQESRIS
ncbi:MAG TPA: hypothetical protein VLS90_16700, partial [Thermodesulfobacteriota bacterium]|nr:hypothetical protein [Thermodesulfobacteriota bacterium]